MSEYKLKRTLEERISDFKRITNKYKNRVPIIVIKDKNIENDTLNTLSKSKFLVPKDITFGQFIFLIRKQLELKPENAIFLIIDNKIPPVSNIMSQIQKEYAEKDGFIYVKYSTENTFG